MKEITNVSAYLAISCVHLGTSNSVLNVLAQVQKYYNAKVLHLGKVATDEEVAMYARRTNKIKTWEKIDKELTDRQQLNIKTEKAELNRLEIAQRKRVRLLQNMFGEDVEFIINKDQMLPIGMDWNEVGTEKDLGKYLKASSVPPNGEKVSFSPITPRSFSYFRKRESSFITPHPTPVLRSFNREGLNKSYVMMSTGSLQVVREVNRCSEHHFVSNLPSAVLILIDNETGEFHSKRLHFETLDCPGISKPLFVLDDGLVFTSSGVSEASSDDKAVFVTDSHAPFEHRGVLSSAIALVNLHKPATFVDGGDTCDMISVCRFNEGKPGLQEGKRLLDDLMGMKRVTDVETANVCIKNKIMLDSNHPMWLTNFVNKNPCLIGMLDIPSLQKMYWSDWHFTDPLKNEVYKFGDLVIRHGHSREGNLSSASNIFIKYLCGHWHSHNCHLRAGSAGAACGLGPAYLENAVTSWTNCITSITRSRGISSFNIKSVLHSDDKKLSRFAYRGKIIEVQWHKYADEK